jgi:hypothetical protein
MEKIRLPVGRLDFKSSEGAAQFPGGFDSHSFPPTLARLDHGSGPIGRVDAADVIKHINFREAQAQKK